MVSGVKNNANHTHTNNFEVPWRFKRVKIRRASKEIRDERYSEQPQWVQLTSYIVSKIIQKGKLLRTSRKFILYRITMQIMHEINKILHNTKCYGKENIPKDGAIFIINHPDTKWDVVVPFMSGFKKPLGLFTDFGDSYLADVTEHFGIVPRLGKSEEMVEKMIRKLLHYAPHFAIWPEGTINRNPDGGIMQGFSGIIKVYATVNAKRNLVPIVPVIMQNYLPKRGPEKITFTFLKPYYLDRDWLKPENKGGKSSRYMIDYVMLKIARVFGQKKLMPNHLLERRKNARPNWH